MDRETLIKYLSCETSPDEERAILDWLDVDTAHREELDTLSEMFNVAVLHAPNPFSSKRYSLKRFLRNAIATAATIAIAIGIGYLVSDNRIDGFCNQTIALRSQAGQRIDIKLQDGTRVWLNGESEIQYPVAFNRKERRVKISGEVMFDVTADKTHPFLVETHAGTIEVLGTKFDVIADPSRDIFTTSLLRGSVKVSCNDKTIELSPGQYASIDNGSLKISDIEHLDDFLWTDGIITINSDSFDHIVSKLERVYNITINLSRHQPPSIQYHGKIRIEEGLDHALQIVLSDTGCDYYIDRDSSLVEIY